MSAAETGAAATTTDPGATKSGDASNGTTDPAIKPDDLATVNQTRTEFDSILPELSSAGKPITLAESEIQLPNKSTPGVECKVNPIRTRELLAIGRILTGSTRPINLHGIIAPLLEAETEDEQIAAALAAFTNLIVTVPHSEREFIELLQALIVPIDEKLSSSPNSNQVLADFVGYMRNPEPLDAARIIAQAYVNERDRMTELGKALIAMWPTLSRVANAPIETKTES